MGTVRRIASTSIGAAVIGGLIVAVFGWIAISAGWIEGGDGEGSSVALAQPSLPQPASQETGGDGLTVNEIYRRVSPGVAFIQAERKEQPSVLNPFDGGGSGVATGSGFVIDQDGHVLTNAHVVNGATRIQVTLGRSDSSPPVSADVVGRDPSTDIALLKVDAPADQLHPLPLGNSAQARVGNPVVAIGNPFGLDRTVTSGIVSALQRQIKAPNGFTIDNVVQTDAAINPGNSGGPLLDANGQVIGINSQIESAGGSGNVGIGFAVPVNTARDVVEQLLESGSVEHAFLGISGTDLTPQIANALNLSADQGALVQSVTPGGPAAEAGVEGGSGEATVTVGGARIRTGGDVITAIDGQAVQTMTDVISTVNSKQPGDSVELALVNGSEKRTLSLTLGDRPANAKQ